MMNTGVLFLALACAAGPQETRREIVKPSASPEEDAKANSDAVVTLGVMADTADFSRFDDKSHR